MAKSLSELPDILKLIENESETIIKLLGDFLSENKFSSQDIILEDVNKIENSCKQLKIDVADELTKTPLDKQDDETYLSNLRHGLFNRVNAIKGYSELILDEFENTETSSSEILKKIEIASLKISKLIDSIRPNSLPTLTTQTYSFKASDESSPISTNFDKDSDFLKFKAKFSTLIVDDNKENCLLLERYLNRIGFTNTMIAQDGYQALAMKDRADLMLLDVNMPEISGIDVLKSIKNDIIQGRIMVVVISGADSLENTIKCIQLGAEDFLTKPFNADLLEVRINACIEKKWAIIQQNTYREKLKFEKNRYEKLLNAVFPPVIVHELANTGKVQATYYNNVAVLFADIVSFTSYCDKHDPIEIINNLQEFAALCESLASKNGMQKIKTMGDCFLGVSGLLTGSVNPVLDCINFSHELISSLNQLSTGWQLRIGINFGTVIGGIVGHRQYLFDIWGDTVNTASRVESLAQPNKIYLSKAAWDKVRDLCKGQSIGEQKVKGKDPFEVFIYEGKL